MSRPRKPTALHLLQGTEQKHPERMRLRENEPKPAGPAGKCPERLGNEIAEAWDYILSKCAPGVMTSMDEPTLQLAAMMLAKFWVEQISFSSTDLRALQSLLSTFGMNPSDRSKVIVPKPGPADSPFAKFRRP